jgi:hypothetical protein
LQRTRRASSDIFQIVDASARIGCQGRDRFADIKDTATTDGKHDLTAGSLALLCQRVCLIDRGLGADSDVLDVFGALGQGSGEGRKDATVRKGGRPSDEEDAPPQARSQTSRSPMFASSEEKLPGTAKLKLHRR